MRQRASIKRTSPTVAGRLLSTVMTFLPGAWIHPKYEELIALYRLRYKMALEDQKHDTALIFLNKILELDPMNVEAKLCKGEIYHRCMGDYSNAIELYKRVIRLTANRREDALHQRAQASLSEIMELFS
ncbi:MAG TPA: hypothetical protein VEZ11_15245 [Thermoanaerobaculia bacterium]|nr:hypothetical protein [Thermoanaerobaculia bacterium]